jgi:hypothetical protein
MDVVMELLLKESGESPSLPKNKRKLKLCLLNIIIA